MRTVGIICEYNPFHNGHKKQIDTIRSLYGADTRIVCAMSGNFVQRGAPALFDKSLRAQAAVMEGADLVVELPVIGALSSAEGFAECGIRILAQCCDTICFGTESMGRDALFSAARALLSPEFSGHLKEHLQTGISFPAARQAALEQLGIAFEGIALPNNLLAVEYCKSIVRNGFSLDILPIARNGNYHDRTVDPENPSATSIRQAALIEGNWTDAIPEKAAAIFENAPMHDLYAGERAILMQLRTMTDDEFAVLPFGSEGLWRKLMKASRSCASLEEIAESVKSKRYTRSRIDRMILCAFLGITAEDLAAAVPYARILAFSESGRIILKNTPYFINCGVQTNSPWEALETRCGDLYGLFRLSGTDSPGKEKKRRVYYRRDK